MTAILGTDETMLKTPFKQANMPTIMGGRAVISIHTSVIKWRGWEG
jgi:hypothetical protein